MTSQASRAGRRAENVRRIQELLAEGKTSKEAAETLGLSYSTVREYITDPEGLQAKRRKDSFRRPCPGCGKLMDGGSGAGSNRPLACGSCAPHFYAEAALPNEAILDAMRKWAEEHGRAPSITDWSKAHARGFIRSGKATPEKMRELIAALSDGRVYPSHGVVKSRFGSWEAAIRAAGLEPRWRKRHLGPNYAVSHRDPTIRDEDLLAELRNLATNGVAPSKWNAGTTLRGRIESRFGTWTDGVHAAGLITKLESKQQARANLRSAA